MLNENYRLTPYNSRWVTLSWTCSDASLFSWIIINGASIYGPVISDSAERSVRVPFKAGTIVTLEVHDLGEDEVPEAIYPPLNTTPTLRWNFLDSAVRYRIYHRVRDGEDKKVYDAAAYVNQVTSPVELEGDGELDNSQYHFLRVEAVDCYGNESTRQSWRFFSKDLPASDASLSISQGPSSGIFDITLE
jgi:hypothetical protein